MTVEIAIAMAMLRRLGRETTTPHAVHYLGRGAPIYCPRDEYCRYLVEPGPSHSVWFVPGTLR